MREGELILPNRSDFTYFSDYMPTIETKSNLLEYDFDKVILTTQEAIDSHDWSSFVTVKIQGGTIDEPLMVKAPLGSNVDIEGTEGHKTYCQVGGISRYRVGSFAIVEMFNNSMAMLSRKGILRFVLCYDDSFTSNDDIEKHVAYFNEFDCQRRFVERDNYYQDSLNINCKTIFKTSNEIKRRVNLREKLILDEIR